MKDYISKLLRTEDAREMKNEYRVLLSTGMSEEEAEDAIISFFFAGANELQTGALWIILALVQWTFGRLSARTFAMAKRWIEDPQLALSAERVSALNEVLNSPMPDRKKVSRVRTRKCPWREGALLAYRIVTCADEAENRFWGKYVLLRVIEIKRWPVSSILPDLLYNESMYVALYNWVGDEIPNSDIVSDLEFTHIEVDPPLIPQFRDSPFYDLYLAATANASDKIMLDETYTHYLYILSWGSKKEAAGYLTEISDGTQDVFHFDRQKQKARIPPICGPGAFDIVLMKRLEELFPD